MKTVPSFDEFMTSYSTGRKARVGVSKEEHRDLFSGVGFELIELYQEIKCVKNHLQENNEKFMVAMKIGVIARGERVRTHVY